MSLVSRARKNTTTLTAEELEELLPGAKRMLHKGSDFQALFQDPDWVYAWRLKYPDMHEELLPDLIDDDVIDYDIMLKHSDELKKKREAEKVNMKKRCRGGSKKNNDSEWSRDREDEKAAARDQEVAVEVESKALDRLIVEKKVILEMEIGEEVEVEAEVHLDGQVVAQESAQAGEASEVAEVAEAAKEVPDAEPLSMHPSLTLISLSLSLSISMVISLSLSRTVTLVASQEDENSEPKDRGGGV